MAVQYLHDGMAIFPDGMHNLACVVPGEAASASRRGPLPDLCAAPMSGL